MSRLVVAVGLMVWAGSALLLSKWDRLARPSLTERLRPFHPGAVVAARRTSAGPSPTMYGAVGPLVRDLGDRLARAFGVGEGAARRLARVHSPLTATTFRLRQAALVAASAVTAGVLSLASGAPAALALLLLGGGPILAFLVVEQRLAHRSEEWQRLTSEELPVMAEQLAMLLNAGYSVGSALGRLAARGRGCVARDLQDVVNRVQQGLREADALGEWADRVGVEPVRRLVAVLALHADSSDLGRLVSAEARAARRDLQRRTVERIERRAQQVWVPVTVATLVPGAILLAVPFLAALHSFANA